MHIDAFLDRLLVREGGFVDHPADKGGATNYGITQATLSDWLGRPAAVDEVRALTRETAKAIYFKTYYADPGLDELPAAIGEQMFDMGVNHGPRRAIRILQIVLNVHGYGPLSQDGALGPLTYAAARRAAAAMDLANTLVDARIRFYRQIVAKDPSQRVFLKGWLRRAEDFRVPSKEQSI